LKSLFHMKKKLQEKIRKKKFLEITRTSLSFIETVAFFVSANYVRKYSSSQLMPIKVIGPWKSSNTRNRIDEPNIKILCSSIQFRKPTALMPSHVINLQTEKCGQKRETSLKTRGWQNKWVKGLIEERFWLFREWETDFRFTCTWDHSYFWPRTCTRNWYKHEVRDHCLERGVHFKESHFNSKVKV